MPHSQRANAIQWALSVLLEGDRIAVADLLDRDQRHPAEHVGVLGLLPEFLEGAHHGDGSPASAAAFSRSSACHCRMAFRTASAVELHLRRLSARAASLG